MLIPVTHWFITVWMLMVTVIERTHASVVVRTSAWHLDLLVRGPCPSGQGRCVVFCVKT